MIDILNRNKFDRMDGILTRPVLGICFLSLCWHRNPLSLLIHEPHKLQMKRRISRSLAFNPVIQIN
jgi:hypothetical protein